MAGRALVLPTSRTSWAQGGVPLPSPRVHLHLHARPLALPRSSFFAWEARAHFGSPSLRLIFSCPDRLLISKSIPRRFVHASLFGVGAPEALVIAVVALVVFGPRGLAEVARTLGKTLRAFQPTIRELQQISRDFKDTLDQEIGLDELRSMDGRPSQPLYKSDQQSQASNVQNGHAEDYLRVTEEQAKASVPEEQRKGLIVMIKEPGLLYADLVYLRSPGLYFSGKTMEYNFGHAYCLVMPAIEAAAWGDNLPTAKAQAEEWS